MIWADAREHDREQPHPLPDNEPDPAFDPDLKPPRRPQLLQIIGPGLITGASDDDPSGIATCSQAGAQFG